MALEGTIKDFGLPDIFQLIGLQRKTGVLTLRGKSETVTVTFETGMVVNADSSAKRIEARLGSLLVKQGKLTEEQLDEVLRRQKETLQRVGHILIAGRFVSPEDLKQALQVQISTTVFRVFRWKEGEYHFEQAEKVQYDREHFDPMSADFILMEGIRMVDEWPMIERKIPSLDVVFRPLVDPSQVQVGDGDELDDVLGAMGGAAAANKITLSPREARLLGLVDGHAPVQALIDATGLGDFDVCKTLFDLLSRDLVALEKSRTATGTLPPAVRAARGPASSVPGYVLMFAALAVAGVSLAVQSASPWAVTGLHPLLRRPRAQARMELTRRNLERVDQAVQALWLSQGSAPAQLEELVQAGLLDARHLLDGEQQPLQYTATASGFVLAAATADGVDSGGLSIERTWPAPGGP
jgi:hypothetical protein